MSSPFSFDQLFYFISIIVLFAAYFVRLEHRLTRIETKLETLCRKDGVRKNPEEPPLP